MPVSERVRTIAVEEAFATRDLLSAWRGMLERAEHGDPGFASLYGPLLSNPAMRPMLDQLVDLGPGRIAQMDAAGVDMQVLSITAPGVQLFSAHEAPAWSRDLNDALAETVRASPGHFAGLAAVPPQAPAWAAGEAQRAKDALGLAGVIINSHTHGGYLDEPRFTPLLEALEALELPLYLHPNTPAPAMVAPYTDYGLVGPMWGFAAETALHALRMIFAGVFDRFPRLCVLLGHLGEGIPFWMPRIDSRSEMSARFLPPAARRLQRKPSEYLRDNFLITTSGMNWPGRVEAVVRELGSGRVLFAADHPYEAMGEAARQIRACELADGARRDVLHANAERVFRLPSSESK